MRKKHVAILRFGKAKKERKPEKRAASPDTVLLSGFLIVAVFFFASLSDGSLLGADAKRIESALEKSRENAAQVMSESVEDFPHGAEERPERLRENDRDARDVGGEAAGYLNGRWNLWEYLGDVLADLLGLV